MKTNYDVVVIGAGVIGAMTAKTLAERGRQTLILERSSSGTRAEARTDSAGSFG